MPSKPEGSVQETCLYSNIFIFYGFLLILLEIVFLPQHSLHRILLMRKISLESRAEVDVPAPESTEERFRILVVMRSEFAVFAGVFVHGNNLIINYKKENSLILNHPINFQSPQ